MYRKDLSVKNIIKVLLFIVVTKTFFLVSRRLKIMWLMLDNTIHYHINNSVDPMVMLLRYFKVIGLNLESI